VVEGHPSVVKDLSFCGLNFFENRIIKNENKNEAKTFNFFLEQSNLLFSCGGAGTLKCWKLDLIGFEKTKEKNGHEFKKKKLMNKNRNFFRKI